MLNDFMITSTRTKSRGEFTAKFSRDFSASHVKSSTRHRGCAHREFSSLIYGYTRLLTATYSGFAAHADHVRGTISKSKCFVVSRSRSLLIHNDKTVAAANRKMPVQHDVLARHVFVVLVLQERCETQHCWS